MSDKPTVLIVGLIRQQSHEIEKRFRGRLHLRFLPAEVPTSRIQEQSRSADNVVIMTRFVSHRVQTALRKHSGLTWCNGSVSHLQTLLQEMTNESKAPP